MMLDDQVLGAPLLDPRGLDLDSAGRITYVLEQSFRYDYDTPVESLRQRLVVVPKARHGSQHRRAHLLEVTGARASRRLRRDARGNVVALLHAERVARAVEFRVAALIERVRDDGPTMLPARALSCPGLLRPTRLTGADDRLRALAADLPAGPAAPLEQAEQICDLVPQPRPWRSAAGSARTTRT